MTVRSRGFLWGMACLAVCWAGCAHTAWQVPSFDQAVSSGSSSRLEMARLSEQVGRQDLAGRFYRDVLEQDPNNPVAHHRLAAVAAREGRWAEADEHFAQAQRLGGDNAELLSDMAYSHYRRRQLRCAESTARQALELDPDHAKARSLLALVLQEQGRHRESIAQFRRVVRADGQPIADELLADVAAGHADSAETAASRHTRERLAASGIRSPNAVSENSLPEGPSNKPTVARVVQHDPEPLKVAKISAPVTRVGPSIASPTSARALPPITAAVNMVTEPRPRPQPQSVLVNKSIPSERPIREEARTAPPVASPGVPRASQPVAALRTILTEPRPQPQSASVNKAIPSERPIRPEPHAPRPEHHTLPKKRSVAAISEPNPLDNHTAPMPSTGVDTPPAGKVSHLARSPSPANGVIVRIDSAQPPESFGLPKAVDTKTVERKTASRPALADAVGRERQILQIATIERSVVVPLESSPPRPKRIDHAAAALPAAKELPSSTLGQSSRGVLSRGNSKTIVADAARTAATSKPASKPTNKAAAPKPTMASSQTVLAHQASPALARPTASATRTTPATSVRPAHAVRAADHSPGPQLGPATLTSFEEPAGPIHEARNAARGVRPVHRLPPVEGPAAIPSSPPAQRAASEAPSFFGKPKTWPHEWPLRRRAGE